MKVLSKYKRATDGYQRYMTNADIFRLDSEAHARQGLYEDYIEFHKPPPYASCTCDAGALCPYTSSREISKSFLVLLLLEFKFLGRNGGFGLPMALLALGQPPGQVVRTRVGRAT